MLHGWFGSCKRKACRDGKPLLCFANFVFAAKLSAGVGTEALLLGVLSPPQLAARMLQAAGRR